MVSSADPVASASFLPPLAAAQQPRPQRARLPPPLEEDLVTHTRWPETGRLFGHSNEIVCLALNSAGTLAATACKARTEAAAAICIWDAVSGALLQRLAAHKLSVVALAFSHARSALEAVAEAPLAPPDAEGAGGKAPRHVVFGPSGKRRGGKRGDAPSGAAAEDDADVSEFLVSVSKDRSVAIWGHTAAADRAAHRSVGSSSGSSSAAAAGAGGGPPFQDDGSTAASTAHISARFMSARAVPPPEPFRMLAIIRKAHKRIIWGVSWAPTPLLQPLLRPALGPGGSAGADSNGGVNFGMFATGSRDHTVKVWTLCRRPRVEPDAAAKAQSAVDEASSRSTETAAPSTAASARASKRAAVDADDAAGGGLNDDDGDAAGTGGAGLADESSIALAPVEAGVSSASKATTAAADELALVLQVTLPPFPAAVTAVSFAPIFRTTTRLVDEARGGAPHYLESAASWLAIGLESGAVAFWRGTFLSSNTSGAGAWQWAPFASIPDNVAHVGALRALAWRPPPMMGSPETDYGGGASGNFVHFHGAAAQQPGKREEAEVAAAGGAHATLHIATASADESMRILRIEASL